MIDAWHQGKTVILRLCARSVSGLARTLTFNIAYSTLHYFSFRMSGRSFMCDLLFSKTLRHKNYIYIYLPKTKKFGCVGGET